MQMALVESDVRGVELRFADRGGAVDCGMADNINTRTTESVPYSMARSTIEDLSPRNGSDDGLGSLSAVRLTGPCGDGDHVTLTEKHKTMRLDLQLSGRR